MQFQQQKARRSSAMMGPPDLGPPLQPAALSQLLRHSSASLAGGGSAFMGGARASQMQGSLSMAPFAQLATQQEEQQYGQVQPQASAAAVAFAHQQARSSQMQARASMLALQLAGEGAAVPLPAYGAGPAADDTAVLLARHSQMQQPCTRLSHSSGGGGAAAGSAWARQSALLPPSMAAVRASMMPGPAAAAAAMAAATAQMAGYPALHGELVRHGSMALRPSGAGMMPIHPVQCPSSAPPSPYQQYNPLFEAQQAGAWAWGPGAGQVRAAGDYSGDDGGGCQ